MTWNPILHELIKARDLTSEKAVDEDKRRDNLMAALDLYTELISQSGESAELVAAIAHCYLEIEKTLGADENHTSYFSQALQFAKRAVEIKPDDAGLHELLGFIYYVALVDYDSAAHEYRRAISLSPCDADIRVEAAFILCGPPDSPVTLQEAMTWLEQAVSLEPGNPDYLAFLGSLYHRSGRDEDAARVWVRALLRPGPLQEGYFHRIKTTVGIR